MMYRSCRSVATLIDAAVMGTDTASVVIESSKSWIWGTPLLPEYQKMLDRWAEANAAGKRISRKGKLNVQDVIARDWTEAEAKLGFFMTLMESMEHIVNRISVDSGCGKSRDSHSSKPPFSAYCSRLELTENVGSLTSTSL